MKVGRVLFSFLAHSFPSALVAAVACGDSMVPGKHMGSPHVGWAHQFSILIIRRLRHEIRIPFLAFSCPRCGGDFISECPVARGRTASAKFFAVGARPVRGTNTLDNQGGLRRSKI